MKCEESEQLHLEDGATRIFLNTRGTNDAEVSEELVNLLHYFEESTDETASSSSESIQALHRQVCRIKASEEIGVRYMQEWEEKAYVKEEGRKEALLSLIARKQAKGKSVAEIAEDLETEVSDVESLMKELQAISKR